MGRVASILVQSLMFAVAIVAVVSWFSGAIPFWVIALMSGVVGVLYLITYSFSARRSRGPEPRLPAMPDDRVFIGGGRWPRPWGRHPRWNGGGNATSPLVELRIGEGRVLVRLRGKLLRGVFSPFFRAVELPLGELTVDPIKAVLGGGLRLATAEKVGVIFWTSRQQEVIDALVAGGARVGEPDRVWW